MLNMPWYLTYNNILSVTVYIGLLDFKPTIVVLIPVFSTLFTGWFQPLSSEYDL